MGTFLQRDPGPELAFGFTSSEDVLLIYRPLWPSLVFSFVDMLLIFCLLEAYLVVLFHLVEDRFLVAPLGLEFAFVRRTSSRLRPRDLQVVTGARCPPMLPSSYFWAAGTMTTLARGSCKKPESCCCDCGWLRSHARASPSCSWVSATSSTGAFIALGWDVFVVVHGLLVAGRLGVVDAVTAAIQRSPAVLQRHTNHAVSCCYILVELPHYLWPASAWS